MSKNIPHGSKIGFLMWKAGSIRNPSYYEFGNVIGGWNMRGPSNN